MRFARVELAAPAARLGQLAGFYGGALGLPTRTDAGSVTIDLGETTLAFTAGPGAPFYHVALLVPGDRFDAALAWARERIELLRVPESSDPVFDFAAWRARACYFHDPAGNIVELIAHRGIEERGVAGSFAAAEIVGMSELGLVGDRAALARELESGLGIRVWSGSVDEPGRLAFLGEQARTLILSPPGRGWLPTGRPGEPHPVAVTLSGTAETDAELDGGRYRLSGRRT